MLELDRGQAGGDGIVRAPDQHQMHQSHPRQQRNNAPRHDLVLAKQLLGPNISPGQPHGYNCQGESGAPPGQQQRCIVFGFGPGMGRSRVHVTDDDHGFAADAHQPPQRGERRDISVAGLAAIS